MKMKTLSKKAIEAAAKGAKTWNPDVDGLCLINWFSQHAIEELKLLEITDDGYDDCHNNMPTLEAIKKVGTEKCLEYG